MTLRPSSVSRASAPHCRGARQGLTELPLESRSKIRTLVAEPLTTITQLSSPTTMVSPVKEPRGQSADRPSPFHRVGPGSTKDVYRTRLFSGGCAGISGADSYGLRLHGGRYAGVAARGSSVCCRI